MSDPVLTFVILVCFFAAVAAVRYFKTLDGGFAAAARSPIAVGIAAGVVIVFCDRIEALHPILIGAFMTIAAVYVRHTGDESEAADGMLLGALTGAAAAVPTAFGGSNEARYFAELVLAGAIAGYGITFAVFHVADRVRQVLLDAVTAAVAVLAAWTPSLVHRAGISDRRTAIAVAAAVPVITLLTVFAQWRDMRAELAHEAALGFMSDDDARVAAHPLRRLGSGAWVDAPAHREFVRIANRIALRKRQQRNRPDEAARLYQLEIIKLRMQLQQMTAIDRAARLNQQRDHGDDVPSDRMHA